MTAAQVSRYARRRGWRRPPARRYARRLRSPQPQVIDERPIAAESDPALWFMTPVGVVWLAWLSLAWRA